MSVICDYLIVTGMQEEEAMRALNLSLHTADEARRQTFNEVNMDGAGGVKVYTDNVYAAAFNHFIPYDIDDCIAAAPWRYPDMVVVVMSSGDHDIDLHARTVTQMREAVAT